MKALLIVLAFAACVGQSVGAEATPMRAMWVYQTEALLASPKERGDLWAFCRQRRITDLFWQVHFTRAPIGGFALGGAEKTRDFLRDAHAHALRIHALAGDPSHTLTQNHGRVLARADALLAFNRSSASEARFDGLHLDIEPHALPQWKTANDAEKCVLLTQFVDLHTQIAERLHTASPGLVYGADIVFWLDKIKPDGTPVYPVTYRGVTKDAAKHLLDAVDQVGIMSYRDTAEGRNGITALVARTIASADTARGRAWVGVKMADIGPRMETFFGRTEAEMMSALQPVEETYRSHRGYAGLAFFMYEAFRAMP